MTQVITESRREQIPRGMGYPFRTSDLETCVGIIPDPRGVVLDVTYWNRAREWSRPQQRSKGRGPLATLSHDPENETWRCDALEQARSKGGDPIYVHASVYGVHVEAMKHAGVSRRTARDLLQAAITRAIKKPGAWRIDLTLDVAARAVIVRLDRKPVREWEMETSRVHELGDLDQDRQA